jgi:hypothetical protein
MEWNPWTRTKLHDGDTGSSNSVLGDNSATRVGINDNDSKNDIDRKCHNFNLSLHTVTCLTLALFATAIPANAQQANQSSNSPGNTVIANPQATSSGQAVNQAIQVTGSNNFQQTYGGGIQCQTSTLAVSPFSIQGWSNPDQYVTNDVGVAATVSFPLDGGAVELCKEAARTQIARQQAEADKASLDYNLVRVLKCQEIISKGAFLHPSSPYADLCRDVIALGEDGLFRNGVGQVVRSAPVDISTRQDS